MMQRLREALRHASSAEPPNRQYRPNELRPDVVRAERLRRETRRTEPAPRQPVRSLEERQARGLRESVPAPAIQPRPAPTQFAALKTRSGLRQAWLLKEILSPPLALRDRNDDDRDR
jgi:hypothetical protein